MQYDLHFHVLYLRNLFLCLDRNFERENSCFTEIYFPSVYCIESLYSSSFFFVLDFDFAVDRAFWHLILFRK